MEGTSDPAVDLSFRRALLDCYLSLATSRGLAEWLQGLGQDSSGTVQEKQERVREHTKYLSMPRESFPMQTLRYLEPFTTEHLAEICDVLGLSTDGAKDDLYRRVYREVGFREGWLPSLTRPIDAFTRSVVLPFVRWYPIRKRWDYERDYYEAFDQEMVELFGEACVHGEYPIAHGSTLKIDFHVGRPQQPGVGVEFKRPTNNSELQRALGQMDQYAAAYGANLIVVLIPDALTTAQKTLFIEALAGKGIETVVKLVAEL